MKVRVIFNEDMFAPALVGSSSDNDEVVPLYIPFAHQGTVDDSGLGESVIEVTTMANVYGEDKLVRVTIRTEFLDIISN